MKISIERNGQPLVSFPCKSEREYLDTLNTFHTRGIREHAYYDVFLMSGDTIISGENLPAECCL